MLLRAWLAAASQGWLPPDGLISLCLAISLLHAPTASQCISSQRNFFFYTKLWWLISDSEPRPGFLAPNVSREAVSPDFSLFSLYFPFLSYLSCMQTHAKKILPLLSAPARAHSYILTSVQTQGWIGSRGWNQGRSGPETSCERWTYCSWWGSDLW